MLSYNFIKAQLKLSDVEVVQRKHVFTSHENSDVEQSVTVLQNGNLALAYNVTQAILLCCYDL